MEIVPFESEHLFQIEMQPQQVYVGEFITPSLAKSLENEMAFSGIHEGKVLGCAGIVKMWDNRCLMWSYLGKDVGKHFYKVHKYAMRTLSIIPYDRVEATVDDGFEEGHRWIKMLGFKLETPNPMQKYNPNGSAAFLYSRVR
jgi:hypothetical protein